MIKFRLPGYWSTLPRRKPLLLVPVVVFLLVAIVAVWSLAGSGNNNEHQSTQSSWIALQPQPVEQQLGLVGRIQAVTQETLTAPFEGVIQAVATHEGQSVKAGQVLVQFDTTQIDIQLRQAQAELLKAQREVNQLRNWSRSAEVARARRSLQSARTTLENTQANLRDTRALFERGVVARMEVDTLVQQVGAQQQDVVIAQEELRATVSKGEGEERKIAEMELINVTTRFDALTKQRERQTLTAPFDGVVVRPASGDGAKAVFAQPGLQVTQGMPLLTVIGLDRIQVQTKVDESDLHLLREGMPVQISGDGFAGESLEGSIAAIAVQSDSPETSGLAARYDVTVSVDGTPQSNIRLGMSAHLAIILYRNEKGIVVPPQALHSDDDGATWVRYRAKPDDTPSRKTVSAGRAVAQGIEIQGVQSGYVEVPPP